MHEESHTQTRTRTPSCAPSPPQCSAHSSRGAESSQALLTPSGPRLAPGNRFCAFLVVRVKDDQGGEENTHSHHKTHSGEPEMNQGDRWEGGGNSSN